MALSAEWQVGLGSGEFSWTYPMTAPAAPAGATPEVLLSYSSGAVDGMVTTQNTQAPQTGVGWADFANGFVERRYWPCSSDGIAASSDLCWKKENASISLNGRAVEMVKVPGTTPQQWVLKGDPRWKVQLISWFLANGDNNGEHWRVTTPDGTEFWFGETVDSVFQAPVIHDDPGEPCYNNGPVLCNEAWRWNLNRVVDRNGNVTTYSYENEVNHYDGAERVGWHPVL